jgi:hypothetical protein
LKTRFLPGCSQALLRRPIGAIRRPEAAAKTQFQRLPAKCHCTPSPNTPFWSALRFFGDFDFVSRPIPQRARATLFLCDDRLPWYPRWAFNKNITQSRGPCVCAKQAVARGPHFKKVRVHLGPSYRAYRPPQESLTAAKAKSTPLNPIPN